MQKPTFIQRIFSWVYPFTLAKVSSKISGTLEVNLQYGKVVIDSPQANYSYGNLHDFAFTISYSKHLYSFYYW